MYKSPFISVKCFALGNKICNWILSLAAICCLSIFSVESVSAQSARIPQVTPNTDYCGPEGRKLSKLIPDRPIGNFSNACMKHDQCYASGARDVVRILERKFQMSIMRATAQQKEEFRAEMKALRRTCDRAFERDMSLACREVTLLLRDKCRNATLIYTSAVLTIGGKYFDRAVENAFTNRR